MMANCMQIAKTALLCTALALALSGCDRLFWPVMNEVANQSPKVVIGPGYKVLIDGVPTYIFGYDDCPKEDRSPTITALFGPSPTDELGTCIVVDNASKTVRVRYKTAAGLKDESWTIIRGEVEKFGTKFPTSILKRQDGSIVMSADNSSHEGSLLGLQNSLVALHE